MLFANKVLFKQYIAWERSAPGRVVEQWAKTLKYYRWVDRPLGIRIAAAHRYVYGLGNSNSKAHVGLFYRTGSNAMTTTTCPFCSLPTDRILGTNAHALWIRDDFPVSPGHSLVIPKRHMGSFFEATADERSALLTLLDEAKIAATAEFCPDGFNIGINDGMAAGQTVPHLHIQLIPRYRDDVPDCRGGVRWVIPEKADYWSVRSTP